LPFSETRSSALGPFEFARLLAGPAVVPAKPTKSREELSALILARLRPYPAGYALNVVIAAVAAPDNSRPNWRLAFTTRSRRAVPRIAWEIGNKVVNEFDLA
jgi:hypothetical protein